MNPVRIAASLRLLREQPQWQLLAALKAAPILAVLRAVLFEGDSVLAGSVLTKRIARELDAHAIGAMARGRQVVTVGDPKQLPPTNFFDRADADADDDDVEVDLESILDECLGASPPCQYDLLHLPLRDQ